MFTGIIQSIGEVVKADKKSNGLQLSVKVALDKIINLGDSIAVNGVCLTVTAIKTEGRGTRDVGRVLRLSFDAVPETVGRSMLGALKTGDKVNIEAAIQAGEPFGGHFVQGHVDTVGTISKITKHGNEYLIAVNCPAGITDSVIEKGSIALDGISLTVVEVRPTSFSVAIIPFTLKHTILGNKKPGDRINIELDIIGKWVKKLVIPEKGKPVGRGKHYSDEGF